VHLELLIEVFDLADKDELHTFQFFNVPVLCLLSKRFILGHHLLDFRILFILDGIDHLGEFFRLQLVTPFNIVSFTVVLVLDDLDVSDEFFMQASQTTLLERDQVVNVDQVVSESHLVLLFSLVQVTIIHLDHGFFRVNLTVVVLLVDLNIFLKLFSLGQSQHFSPVGEDLHAVEMSHFLLFLHVLLQLLALLANTLHLLVHILEDGIGVPYSDREPSVLVGGLATALHMLS